MSGRGKIVGKWGENLACAFLERHRFFIKERNFYSTVGELDIVAVKDEDYYFIEVKTRAAGELATDLAITSAKKYKMQKTVKKYCYIRGVPDTGIVLVGLLVTYNKINKSVSFRMVIFE
ncbi:MAG: YraN family protein [Candidatus Magasanikbacteria bacterium]|nr:YraN family protein [Candidatus Magasanikbacteria bacterium]